MNNFESYIICATPRSGSTLLCDLFTEAGIAGRPHSFFLEETFSYWADKLGVSTEGWKTQKKFNLAYLSAVKAWGANQTSIFGLRLMWESLNDLSARLGDFYPGYQNDSDRFETAFGKSLYIHLSREDKVFQAVSRYKAECSGLWHKYSDGAERQRVKQGKEPCYDFEAISKIVTTLEAHDSLWSTWFKEQGISPLRITYEDLSINPQAVLASALSALGLDCSVAEAIKPKSGKMADSKSQAWVERFKCEASFEVIG